MNWLKEKYIKFYSGRIVPMIVHEVRMAVLRDLFTRLNRETILKIAKEDTSYDLYLSRLIYEVTNNHTRLQEARERIKELEERIAVRKPQE